LEVKKRNAKEFGRLQKEYNLSRIEMLKGRIQVLARNRIEKIEHNKNKEKHIFNLKERKEVLLDKLKALKSKTPNINLIKEVEELRDKQYQLKIQSNEKENYISSVENDIK